MTVTPDPNPTGGTFWGKLFYAVGGGLPTPSKLPAGLAILNAKRAQAHACLAGGQADAQGPLAWNEDLAQLAADHASLMAYKNVLTDLGYDGSTLITRLIRAGIQYGQAYEFNSNAHSFADAAAGWANGAASDSASCNALGSPMYTQVGIGSARGSFGRMKFCAIMISPPSS